MEKLFWLFLFYSVQMRTVKTDCYVTQCKIDYCEGLTCSKCLSGNYLTDSGICSGCWPGCTECSEFLNCLECSRGKWGYLCQSSCSWCDYGCDIDTGECLKSEPPKTKGQDFTTTNKKDYGGSGSSTFTDEVYKANTATVTGVSVGVSVTVVICIVVIGIVVYYRRRQSKTRSQLRGTVLTPTAPPSSAGTVQYAPSTFPTPNPITTQSPYITPSSGQSLATQPAIIPNTYPVRDNNLNAYRVPGPITGGMLKNTRSFVPDFNRLADMGNALGDQGTLDSGYAELSSGF